MVSILMVAIPIALIAVLAALMLGFGSFVKTDESGVSDGRRQNRLMRWRIGLQFVALLLIMAMIALVGGR